MRMLELIEHARGMKEVDLLLENCSLVNVLTGEVHPARVAVKGGVIVGTDGTFDAHKSVDLGGRYVAPGLIDSHVHLESSMLSPAQFARAVVPRGTTAIVTDCHEIANVLGVGGVEYVLREAWELPLDVFVMAPSCVPATDLETSGARIGVGELKRLKALPEVIGLGEVMNYPGVLSGDDELHEKILLFKGMPVDGHSPLLAGQDLSAYIIAGASSDHECTSRGEVLEKARKGMYVYLREGTAARNLSDLIGVLDECDSSRFCLCTDDRDPHDLISRGHMDYVVRYAIELGLSPVKAIQLATINPSIRFGLKERGAIAPGRIADILVLDDLASFDISMVFKEGVLVAASGEAVFETGASPEVPGSSFNVKDFGVSRLKVEASASRARAMRVIEGQIVTEVEIVDVRTIEGKVVSSAEDDVLKAVVVERHRGTGNLAVALVRGFGLQRGALASSVAHDSHNIVAVGVSDEDIAGAVLSVIEMNGGQAVFANGKCIAELALPIAGLMSDEPVGEVARAVEKLEDSAAALGCVLENPFLAMSFLALPVIPRLKLTDRGIVDVELFKHVPLFVD